MSSSIDPTNAEMLAAMVNKTGTSSLSAASVQRSHRFPVWIFNQIENMARMADVSVSTIINQLLQCGLDAVSEHLSDEQRQELRLISPEQSNRATVMLREGSKNKDKK